MVDIQLVIMAAGMGSRYGGLKQIDEFGPAREFLMDYAIYDAYQVGLRQICLVVRENFRAEIENLLKSKWRHYTDLRFSFVVQETTDLPSEFASQAAERERPWGTAHILYVLRNIIKTPFIIMNADDFYGRAAITNLVHFLTKHPGEHALVSYQLQKTLSPFGPVTRGICEINDGQLVAIDEVSNISPADSRQGFASMNLWGFSPSVFSMVEASFNTFLKENIKDPKKEYQIPQMVNDFLNLKKIRVEALSVDSEWFGVTHREDKEPVQNNITRLVQDGVYPRELFKFSN